MWPALSGVREYRSANTCIALGVAFFTYGDDRLARLLGASTAGIALVFTAVEDPRPGLLKQDGSYWMCGATGFRDPDDRPIYFDDTCH